MTRRLSPRAWLWLPALLLLPCFPSRSVAQFGGLGGTALHSPDSAVKFKEPTSHRVYQRDRNGRATIPIVLDEKMKDAKLVSASLMGGAAFVEGARHEDGKFVGVPAGGPYHIQCEVTIGDVVHQSAVGPVYVGDLWVLAGQSNMEGVGDLVDVTPPNPVVMALGMDGKWRQAEEPLHWLVDSPDPVHSGDAKDREKRSADQHKSRTKGAGLGLPFASILAQHTGVPVGLVAVAHGGTSMDQWSPSKKDEGGKSLYGSAVRQIKLAGGKVTGVVWYQGESDAIGDGAKTYGKKFIDFIAAVRDDFRQPELPFYFVQIGRFVNAANPKGWNAVQDEQRRIPERVPNTAVVSVIDLELDDGIHVGTQGMKRAGNRLAQIALRELFGQTGATTPTLDRVSKGTGNSLVVKFRGVNMGPHAQQAPRAAAMMAGGPGGGGRVMGMGMMGMPGGSVGAGDGQIGLRPARHIGGFSIRDADGKEIPLIFEAAVGAARDTVVLKLTGAVPAKASLWYGHGLDPYCNLTDGLDMAVPVFGPVALDEVK